MAILILPAVAYAKAAPRDTSQWLTFLTMSPYPEIAWSILGIWLMAIVVAAILNRLRHGKSE